MVLLELIPGNGIKIRLCHKYRSPKFCNNTHHCSAVTTFLECLLSNTLNLFIFSLSLGHFLSLPGVMLLEGLVVAVMAVPLLWLLGVTMPSLVQLTIQLSEEEASGLEEKAMWVEAGCCCSSLWSCSKHSASFVWPRERAMDSGRRPRESGMVRALRSHLYRTTAASR